MNTKMDRLWATKTKDDEWWSSFVTSPAAILANYVAVDVKWLTPNRITFASFVTAIVAATFIVAGGTMSFVIAAVLIHLSHIFDCMDGQMARYRGTMSASGSFYDRATDQLQVSLWFGAAGYAAYDQSGKVLPIFLAFIGVAFYSLRGYAKYIEIQIEMSRNDQYLAVTDESETLAVPTTGLKWFLGEQHKILHFNEGVFIFMLSAALVLNQLSPMLWVFAISQTCLGLVRTWQRGQNIEHNRYERVDK